jgi:4-phosphopantoate--beta-alanine ligase
VRAIPNMIKFAEELRELSKDELLEIVNSYNNRQTLKEAIETIRDYLTKMADEISKAF